MSTQNNTPKTFKKMKTEYENLHKTLMSIVPNILIKHDPIGLCYYDDNNKLHNPDEFESEAEQIIFEIYFRGNHLTKEYLNNSIHRIFCMSFTIFSNYEGEFCLPDLDKVYSFVGTKEKYKDITEEIWDILVKDFPFIFER